MTTASCFRPFVCLWLPNALQFFFFRLFRPLHRLHTCTSAFQRNFAHYEGGLPVTALMEFQCLASPAYLQFTLWELPTDHLSAFHTYLFDWIALAKATNFSVSGTDATDARLNTCRISYVERVVKCRHFLWCSLYIWKYGQYSATIELSLVLYDGWFSFCFASRRQVGIIYGSWLQKPVVISSLASTSKASC